MVWDLDVASKCYVYMYTYYVKDNSVNVQVIFDRPKIIRIYNDIINLII